MVELRRAPRQSGLANKCTRKNNPPHLPGALPPSGAPHLHKAAGHALAGSPPAGELPVWNSQRGRGRVPFDRLPWLRACETRGHSRRLCREVPLQKEQVGAVPGGEEAVAMVAVATPALTNRGRWRPAVGLQKRSGLSLLLAVCPHCCT